MSDTPAPPSFNRKNPLIARLKDVWDLTGDCGEKHTAHYVVDLLGSGLQDLPGDSLALLPKNCPELAGEVIAALGCSGDEPVTPPRMEEMPLREALVSHCAITQPDKKFLRAFAEKTGDASIAALLEPEQKEALSDWLWGREIIDLLLDHPDHGLTPQEFVELIKKLNVRLYSISSSLLAHPDECHLTVATVRYESFGRKRKGVCTTWLADRIEVGADMPCFITPGKGFRLPEPDDDVPIIMVGPGTGIAPFRAFLEHREATGAKGDAWLFFGEIHEESCYFYREEFEAYLEKGLLRNLTTAFSRDQDHKIYVQHKIEEHGAELWSWLERGAILYVCGDANRMAVDVDRALHAIISEHGALGEEGAAGYVAQMKTDKRYRRDVY